MTTAIKEQRLKNGRRRVMLDLADGEQVVVVNPTAYYSLGQPMDDVMQGHILAEAVRVIWCPISQKWVN